jgi:hypothetical protein
MPRVPGPATRKTAGEERLRGPDRSAAGTSTIKADGYWTRCLKRGHDILPIHLAEREGCR